MEYLYRNMSRTDTELTLALGERIIIYFIFLVSCVEHLYRNMSRTDTKLTVALICTECLEPCNIPLKLVTRWEKT